MKKLFIILTCAAGISTALHAAQTGMGILSTAKVKIKNKSGTMVTVKTNVGGLVKDLPNNKEGFIEIYATVSAGIVPDTLFNVMPQEGGSIPSTVMIDTEKPVRLQINKDYTVHIVK